MRLGDQHCRGPFQWRFNGPVYLACASVGKLTFWVWDKETGLKDGLILHLSLLSDVYWFNLSVWQAGIHLERPYHVR